MPNDLYSRLTQTQVPKGTMPNGPMAFAPMPHDAQFNTPLAPEDQKPFGDWATAETARRGGRDVMADKEDYDIQGFWKSGQQNPGAADAHYSDQFKKPNHPTFSDQSQYALGSGFQPGSWDQGDFGRDRFTAGKTNLENMSAPGLRNYFRQVEPGVSLDMPSASLPQRLRSMAMPMADPFVSNIWP